ncbi:MAG: YraN family protein [Deltaproteobacteria bacterium]|nr:YraN family protein [Deltaproteobacteria bacterium]
MSLGKQGETFAASFLKGLKYKIIETNYRCRCGEIDIIARDGSVLVFVEVKARRGASYGPPQLSVTPFKQRQISKAALTYLAKNKLLEVPARFDVIALVLRNGEPVVNHIKDAFELAY